MDTIILYTPLSFNWTLEIVRERRLGDKILELIVELNISEPNGLNFQWILYVLAFLMENSIVILLFINPTISLWTGSIVGSTRVKKKANKMKMKMDWT